MDKFLVWLSFFLRSGLVFRRLDVVRVFWEEVEYSSAGFGALDVLDNGLKVVRGKTPRTMMLNILALLSL